MTTAQAWSATVSNKIPQVIMMEIKEREDGKEQDMANQEVDMTL